MLEFDSLVIGKIFIQLEIVAPLYWWEQFGTYPVQIYASQDPITEKKFDWSDFSHEYLVNIGCSNEIKAFEYSKVFGLVIQSLNDARDRYLQCQSQGRIARASAALSNIIQLLPSSYNRKKTVVIRHDILSVIHRDHKEDELPEWREFCQYMEANLPHLIIKYENKQERI